MRRALAMSCAVAIVMPAAARAEPPTRVLVRFAADTSPARRVLMRSQADVERDAMLAVKGLELVEPKAGVSVDQAVTDLEHMRGVLYAEPDYEVHATATPNDPLYAQEWGLPTINAQAAWDVTTGSPQVTVAVVDSGVDTAHPDLAPNVWTNPGETGAGRETNGVDDDGDGRVDDVHGWDFVEDDAQPQDDNGHGTHVAGTIAARGNDGFGVVGVSWATSVMGLRVLDVAGRGFVSDVVSAYALAARDGAHVINASFGGTSYSNAERDAIAAAPNALFVVAAGNAGQDNDATAHYPCNYDLANIICVAASDRDDSLAYFSDYGARNVDLAAPGVDIVSTWPRNRFVRLDGTSMATPHVSGAAALLLARHPGLHVAGLRAALLAGVTPVSALAGLVATGGRLDLAAALAVPVQSAAAPPAPPPPSPAASPLQMAPSGVDGAAPTVGLRILRARLRAVGKRGLRLAIVVSEPCRIAIVLAVDRRTQRRLRLRSRALGRATIRLSAAGRGSVTLRISARARRALRRAARVRVTARAVAIDAAGNRRTVARSATLRR
jgi:subtilisin family serine protease